MTPPTLLMDKNDILYQAFVVGSDAIALCNVTGDPLPHIWWTHGNGTHISQNIDDRVYYLDNGKLLFFPIQETDHNRYTCLARNSVAHRMWEVWVIVIGMHLLTAYSLFHRPMLIGFQA